jgi:hypothetical protein
MNTSVLLALVSGLLPGGMVAWLGSFYFYWPLKVEQNQVNQSYANANISNLKNGGQEAVMSEEVGTNELAANYQHAANQVLKKLVSREVKKALFTIMATIAYIALASVWIVNELSLALVTYVLSYAVVNMATAFARLAR